MLNNLSKEQIIDLVVSTIKVICGDDEKHLKDVTHAILCYAQCNEIMARRDELEAYQEPHKKELFAHLLNLDEKAAAVLYRDYLDSKLKFSEWKATLRR